MPAASAPSPVFSKEAISSRISALAREIDRDFADRRLVLVGVLTGSFIFLADLARGLKLDCEIDFIRVESYGNLTASSGKPKITMNSKIDLTGKSVLLVDEIVDTGLTLGLLLEHLRAKGAAEVRVCALIDKKARRRVDVTIDYTGFTAGDGYLVGYGLDAAEHKRNLPEIHLLEE